MDVSGKQRSSCYSTTLSCVQYIYSSFKSHELFPVWYHALFQLNGIANLACLLAPRLTSSCAHFNRPLWTASCSGVSLSKPGMFTKAPWSNNSSAMATWPWLTASCWQQLKNILIHHTLNIKYILCMWRVLVKVLCDYQSQRTLAHVAEFRICCIPKVSSRHDL